MADTLRDKLIKLQACNEAIDWLGDRDDIKTAWRECERADWMLWLAGKISIDHKTIVLAGVRCGETSLKYVPKGETRPRNAYKVTRRWIKGLATIKEVRVAAAAAHAATYAAYSADAASAAYSAAYSADAASAAYSAAYSADAASAAYSAAYAAYAAKKDRKKAQRLMADIVRKTITLKKVLEAYENSHH